MATHVENRQPNTLIKDAAINVNTLNVNKTSTQEEILAVLPKYFYIDSTSHTNYEFNLNPSVNLNFLNTFSVFLNGNLISKASTLTDDGVYLYPQGTTFKIIGSEYTNIVDQNNSSIHALYTPVGE